MSGRCPDLCTRHLVVQSLKPQVHRAGEVWPPAHHCDSGSHVHREYVSPVGTIGIHKWHCRQLGSTWKVSYGKLGGLWGTIRASLFTDTKVHETSENSDMANVDTNYSFPSHLVQADRSHSTTSACCSKNWSLLYPLLTLQITKHSINNGLFEYAQNAYIQYISM